MSSRTNHHYHRCCIAKCKGTNPLISYHEFPSDHALREKWFENLRLWHDQPTKLRERAVVCSLHFQENCFKTTASGRRLLKHSAVPTLSVTESSNSSESTPMPTQIFATPSTTDSPTCTDDKSTQVNLITREEILEYRREIKVLKMRIRRMFEQDQRKTTELQNMKRTIHDSNYETIMKIKKDADENNLNATFLLDQVSNYGKQTPRFSEMTIRSCNAWRILSTKGYDYCRSNILKLPSRHTLQRYTGSGKEYTHLVKSRLKVNQSNKVVRNDPIKQETFWDESSGSLDLASETKSEEVFLDENCCKEEQLEIITPDNNSLVTITDDAEMSHNSDPLM